MGTTADPIAEPAPSVADKAGIAGRITSLLGTENPDSIREVALATGDARYKVAIVIGEMLDAGQITGPQGGFRNL